MSADLSLKILVIVLSATLAIFLILGIVLIIKLIQVANGIKHITQKAEQIADKAEAVTEFFEQAAAPVAIGRLIGNITDMITRKGRGGKNG